MTRFRPCIDLHAGQVKQIVGGSLNDKAADLRTNHISKHSAGHFAQLYKDKALYGSHVIMLGPGNEDAAREALDRWPQGLQIGGGITDQNAAQWLAWGAAKIIVTSFLFDGTRFCLSRLKSVLAAIDNQKDLLVLDLSCRRRGGSWYVAMNKWQTITEMEVNQENISMLETYCSEFLIHAADNEGLQRGIDEELVQCLGKWCTIPVTYAGGGKSIADLDRVRQLSNGNVDLTIGSALDIFGGSSVCFEDCIKWNEQHS